MSPSCTSSSLLRRTLSSPSPRLVASSSSSRGVKSGNVSSSSQSVVAGDGGRRWHGSTSAPEGSKTSMSFRTREGRIKIDLKSKLTTGYAQSRGERPYQEDTSVITCLTIPSLALKRNLASVKGRMLGAPGIVSDLLEGYSGEELEGGKKQVAMFGVFDGHGGSFVSKFLEKELPGLIEKGDVGSIAKTIKEYRSHGGYLRRYRGGPLERFREPEESDKEWVEGGNKGEREVRGMGLDEMAALAFLQADNQCLANPAAGKSGSVGTVALLHSLDTPSLPPQLSNNLLLTIAHLGDTTALLCTTSTGRSIRLTENHHADSRTESIRLRKSGTGIVTDSFGESRWGGTLANTRGIGDIEFKTLGVFGEPEIVKKVIKGDEFAFLILVSDGVTDSMSDQEVVDLVRGNGSPTRAATKVVEFAENVGGTDNMTAIIVPLLGWSKLGGVDTSESLREFRLRQNEGLSGRSKRM